MSTNVECIKMSVHSTYYLSHFKAIRSMVQSNQSSFLFFQGHCEVGWAYIITIIGGIVAFLSALLPRVMPIHITLQPPNLDKQWRMDRHNGVRVSGTNMPLLLARNAPTPSDQSSLNQSSFSRQGVISLCPGNCLPTQEFHVLVPATPVIIQSPSEAQFYREKI